MQADANRLVLGKHSACEAQRAEHDTDDDAVRDLELVVCCGCTSMPPLLSDVVRASAAEGHLQRTSQQQL